MKAALFRAVLLGAALSLSAPLPAALALETHAEKISAGYGLLYDLAQKEKSANLIFIMKSATPPTKEVTRQISDLFTRLSHDLEVWEKRDDSLTIRSTRLPFIESETREAMEHAHTHDLFSVQGPAFEHLFLGLQEESLYYALYLIETLEKHDQNAARLHGLKGYEEEFHALQLKVAGLL